MSRIRTIKPNFFRNEQLADLPMQVRLLFIGLWTLADKEGKLEDRPKRIKVELFPYDTLDVDSLLTRLQSAGFIIRYEVGELKVIKVINFTKHQRITGSECDSVSEFPEPSQGNILETFGNTEETFGTTGREGKGKEGKGKEAPAAPEVDVGIKIPFSEKFLQVWNSWKDYKLKEFKFRFKSKQSEQASLTELLNLSQKDEATAIAIIQQSLANGWKGFFELKNETQASVSPAKELATIRNHEKQKLQQIELDINYLYERFLEDKCTVISIYTDHYDHLKKRGVIHFPDAEVSAIKELANQEITRQQLLYSDKLMNQLMKKYGVIKFFEQLKAQARETVFDVDGKTTSAS